MTAAAGGLYVGLMSGTSMDAVDAVVVEFAAGVRLLATESTPIPAPLQAQLREIARPGHCDLDRLGELDAELGELFASAALAAIGSAGLAPERVKAIGSHGQTVRHRPRARWPFTLQIGDPARIAARTGIATVADFRRRDMALGGEGAPLACAFHAAAFGSGTEPRAVLNVGGIANVTLLVPGQPVAGWDTGPGNVYLDAWTRRQLGRPWDEGGAWAASGRVDEALLKALLSHPFCALAPPKSTGPEEFSLHWLDEVLARAPVGADRPEDVQATLSEFTAAAVGASLGRRRLDRLLVCGGGALNEDLLRRLRLRLPGTHVETTAALGLDPRWIEAAAFAWLAARTLAGQPGNLPSVTGARQPAVLGAIHPA
jgi:anhydro-N-acetylmuramic acid kinase